MEASTLTVTPLYGAHSADPPCYLLEIDDFTILLDAGWTEAFDVALLEPLRTVAPRVDIVLISHCDVEHLGALAYAMKHFELRAPVYASLPVSKMGQMFMYDSSSSRLTRRPPSAVAAPHCPCCHSHGPGRPG